MYFPIVTSHHNSVETNPKPLPYSSSTSFLSILPCLSRSPDHLPTGENRGHPNKVFSVFLLSHRNRRRWVWPALTRCGPTTSSDCSCSYPAAGLQPEFPSASLPCGQKRRDVNFRERPHSCFPHEQKPVLGLNPESILVQPPTVCVTVGGGIALLCLCFLVYKIEKK